MTFARQLTWHQTINVTQTDRNMKIYTKTGDGGQTSLIGGTRVSKGDLQLEAYGTLDELQAHVAHLYDQIESDKRCAGILEQERKELLAIVTTLMSAEAHLASDGSGKKMLPPFGAEHTELIERAIDRMLSVVPTLNSFTLPTGDTLFSYTHICRTVARRAERCAVRAASEHDMPTEPMRYINRLSDYFYALGRYLCHALNIKEHVWVP